MTLDKNDLQEIKKIVDISVEKNINDSDKELKDYIGKEIGSLAAMTKRGFDDNDAAHTKLLKGQLQIRKDISNLEFIATEMVRRDEFLELKRRLSRIEAQLGMVK
ncbi:MAG TPA: hypothetical protein VJK26_02710 [Patescibacteria group bacterium]|nr:hypothetical protein [Patescibacteria group bacterium]